MQEAKEEIGNDPDKQTCGCFISDLTNLGKQSAHANLQIVFNLLCLILQDLYFAVILSCTDFLIRDNLFLTFSCLC